MKRTNIAIIGGSRADSNGAAMLFPLEIVTVLIDPTRAIRSTSAYKN
jgi:hypothetical protein